VLDVGRSMFAAMS